MGFKPGPMGTGRHTTMADLTSPVDHASMTEAVIHSTAIKVDEVSTDNAARVGAELAMAQSNLAIAAAIVQLNSTLRRAHGIYD